MLPHSDLGVVVAEVALIVGVVVVDDIAVEPVPVAPLETTAASYRVISLVELLSRYYVLLYVHDRHVYLGNRKGRHLVVGLDVERKVLVPLLDLQRWRCEHTVHSEHVTSHD